MKTVSLIGLLTIIFTVLSQNAPYRKIVHGTDPEAKCLDGSPGALYLFEGDPKNILMYFVGGASCAANDLSQTLQSCYQRSKIHLGSSTYWPQTNTFSGILSNDGNQNIFANWTKAVFLYCDGAFHQGNGKSPLKYKDSSLYFRGGAITRSHFKFIDSKYPFIQAERVVLTGSSAGGMATYIWADYLKALLGANTKFYSIPDSGIFLNPADDLRQASNLNYIEAVEPLQVLLSISNKDQTVPNAKCASAVGKQNQFKCLSIATAYNYLQTQSLFLQSSYDQYIIRWSAGFTCIKEGVSGFSLKDCDEATMAIIENYRSYYMQFLKKILARGHNIWSISCSWHAMEQFSEFYDSPLQKVPHTSGRTMQEAVYSFVFENNKVLDIDIDPWPSNAPCAY